MGIEPTFEAWEAPVLPLNYTREVSFYHSPGAGRTTGYPGAETAKTCGFFPVASTRRVPDVHWTGDRNTIDPLNRSFAPAMKITLNGEDRSLERPMTVSELLLEIGAAGKRVAVEVNQEIVPRSEHTQYQLKNDDRVEVVQAIGGG